jgi:hypothetical protein
MKKQTQTFTMAVIFVITVMTLFFLIVLRQLGGREALFLIIGHVAAWVEFVVIFYFRKKPKDDINNTAK